MNEKYTCGRALSDCGVLYTGVVGFSFATGFITSFFPYLQTKLSRQIREYQAAVTIMSQRLIYHYSIKREPKEGHHRQYF